jgi:hypothetical protein
MQMSDVLACEVYDAAGRKLGQVRDVRLVLDGPVLGGNIAAPRIDALIVGGSALAGRLGYLRGGVRGPALVAAIMRRLENRALTIAATDVANWDLADQRLELTTVDHAGHDPDASS